MADDFQDDFIVDFTPGELAGTETGPGRETDLVEQRLRYSLDTGGGEDEPDIAVNLGPLVAGTTYAICMARSVFFFPFSFLVTQEAHWTASPVKQYLLHGFFLPKGINNRENFGGF